MFTSNIDPIEIMILLLLIFVVGFGIIANSLKIAYPIILVIGGLILSLIPGMPRFTLTPEIVFVVFLPPLIFSGAFNTSWRDLKVNFEPIFLLAVGLVAFTAIGIAFVAGTMLHGFDWRLGLILGAVVAPTDTIAVLSIAKRFGLKQRILDIIEGESLLNDASGLLTLEFAVAIVITGITPTLSESIIQFVYLIIAGIIIGLIGFVARI